MNNTRCPVCNLLADHPVCPERVGHPDEVKAFLAALGATVLAVALPVNFFDGVVTFGLMVGAVSYVVHGVRLRRSVFRHERHRILMRRISAWEQGENPDREEP